MDDKKKKEEVKKEASLGHDTKEAEELKNESGLQEKLNESEDKYKRALADYQNLVRRTVEEKREWARISNKDLILKLLPILDTLMLAEKHTKDGNFTLAVQQFLQVLKDEGLEKIKTVGEEFNPHNMEAVNTGEGEENKVIEELRAGYIMGEMILRPAQVTVGKKKE